VECLLAVLGPVRALAEQLGGAEVGRHEGDAGDPGGEAAPGEQEVDAGGHAAPRDQPYPQDEGEVEADQDVVDEVRIDPLGDGSRHSGRV